jgi:exodeoxyribonuclease-3
MVSRIISLNLRHGGGGRIAYLTDWLASKSPSAVIATEWRNNLSGQYLRDRLTLGGLQSILAPQAKSQINTVLLAAKDIKDSQAATPLNSPEGDLVSISTKDGVSILGCYFPQRMAKSPFFRRCTEMAASNSDRPFVMIGDFNTGRNDFDIEGNGVPFHCADQFAGLHEQAGLVDLWRLRHGERRDWTWRSAKNGFRIDHAFGNQVFLKRYPNFRCEIDHEPRLVKLTDHSAIIVDFE